MKPAGHGKPLKTKQWRDPLLDVSRRQFVQYKRALDKAFEKELIAGKKVAKLAQKCKKNDNSPENIAAQKAAKQAYAAHLKTIVERKELMRKWL